MQYVISQKFGAVYSKEDNDICCSPISIDGSFNTEDSGAVETWDNTDVAEQDRIIKLLA
jgi:hypothetical protein